MERNRKAGQNPPRVVAPTEEEEEDKTLHVSGIFSAHHQEFSTVHSALVSFMQVFDDRFQAESGWNLLEPSGPVQACPGTAVTFRVQNNDNYSVRVTSGCVTMKQRIL